MLFKQKTKAVIFSILFMFMATELCQAHGHTKILVISADHSSDARVKLMNKYKNELEI